MSLKHTVVDGRERLKGKVEDLLRSRARDPELADRGLTLGEILTALDLNKTRNAEVASVLNKCRNEGKVRFETGPRTGKLGPRYVKRYRWAAKTPPAATAPAQPPAGDAELRRALANFR